MLLCQYAKSSPLLPNEREIAFKRAKTLDNGISISWLEQTWNNDILKINGVKTTDLALLKKLGFKTLRLPVAFEFFKEKHIPDDTILNLIDNILKLCRRYGFKLIVDYHYGNLNNDNYLTATKSIIDTWNLITWKYRHKFEDDLFFEIYNEPLSINPKIWKDAAYNIVTAIHKIDSQRTLLVGASNYNSIYELSRFVRLKDENIIYTFHFYEPFLFTHQGAEWIGGQAATTGVPFPYNVEKFPPLNPKAKNTWGETNYYKYNKDANAQAINDKLQIVKNWSDRYFVPVLCSEYGCYNKYADEQSRCNYIKTVRQALKKMNIPGILWDYNTNFSIFRGQPSLKNIDACMQDAIGYTAK